MLKSKVITKNHGFLIVHLIKPLECELCKTKIPGKKYLKQFIYKLYLIYYLILLSFYNYLLFYIRSFKIQGGNA